MKKLKAFLYPALVTAVAWWTSDWAFKKKKK